MKRFDQPILVTRPYLPDLEEFKAGCEEIWTNQWLTNNGPVLERFQAELSCYLGVPEANWRGRSDLVRQVRRVRSMI